MKGIRWSEEELAEVGRRLARTRQERVASRVATTPPATPQKPHSAPAGKPRGAKKGYEKLLEEQILLAGLPPPVLEYPFLRAQGRRFRLDLAWPDLDPPLAVEIDGAVHRIKARFARDLEKHQLLFLAGWRLLRVSPAQVRDGSAAELVEQALKLFAD